MHDIDKTLHLVKLRSRLVIVPYVWYMHVDVVHSDIFFPPLSIPMIVIQTFYMVGSLPFNTGFNSTLHHMY